MPTRSFDKDPNAILDYAIDYRLWLGDDVIATSTWNVDEGITVEESPAPSVADGIATLWLSGGTVGQSYTQLTTSSPRRGVRMTARFAST